MTSKRPVKADAPSAVGAVRRSRGASATHSRKPAAAEATSTRSESIEHLHPDTIARLAYSYWEGRGGVAGSPEEDWLRAESELLSLQRSLESA